jgi:DNA-binding response OmpR family regulator/anti-sigma regulatory factor (Ser/Thr protein kinase)
VLNNLLTNAFKFTNNGGSINIVIETDNEAVYLIVKDTGIGMSEAYMGQIFNRFYQIKNAETKDKSGFGLGLSIAKEIIELHKGTIEVKSEKNKGSIFEVKLLKSNAHFYENEIEKTEVVPNQGIETINHLKQKIEKNEVKKATVLIVEDNTAIQESLKEILSADYLILQAFDGEEGLQIATKEFPDLIISDVMMPVMDGIEFVKNLKLNTFTSHIPIIILTARTTVKNTMEGFETGADDYIAKPYDEELLKTRISNLLNNRKLIREKFISDNLLNPKMLAISSPDQLFLERLYANLEPNLESNSLKAEDIAKEIGMSHSVMYKKIKGLTGLSYVEFIRDYRLSIAKQLIQDLGYSVSDACYKVGYSDRKYFSKLFKEKFKKNPSEFLKS